MKGQVVWAVLHDPGETGAELVAIHDTEEEATLRAVQIVVDAVQQELRHLGEDVHADNLDNGGWDEEAIAEVLGCEPTDLSILLNDGDEVDLRYQAAREVIPWITQEMGSIAVERHSIQ